MKKSIALPRVPRLARQFVPPALVALLIGVAAVDSQSASPSLWERAISDDVVVRSAAIKELRAQGPAGLQSLMRANAPLISWRRTHPRETAPPRWERVSAAVDKVGGQHDDYAANLYWYTDLEAAKKAARASGKPILSLRMLGRLDEELSCANSRFFRTALYPNAQIGRALRDGWILHWSSERPVPVVSIDMGDGRVLKRTLTGNSAHYVLDEEGRPLDVLPGLYAPGAFERWLDRSEKMAASWRRVPRAERATWLQQRHAARLQMLSDEYAHDALTTLRGGDFSRIRQDYLGSVRLAARPAPAGVSAVPSALAGRLAISKVVLESSLLSRISSNGLRVAPDGDIVDAFVPLHREEARLDQNSLDVMRAKNGQIDAAPPIDAPVAASPLAAARQSSRAMAQRVDNPLVQRVDNRMVPRSAGGIAANDTALNFEQSIARDTLRNEYRLHAAIHRWFADGEVNDFATLNTRLYNDIFLTPRRDRWLGLVTPGVYSALDNDGIQKP